MNSIFFPDFVNKSEEKIQTIPRYQRKSSKGLAYGEKIAAHTLPDLNFILSSIGYINREQKVFRDENIRIKIDDNSRYKIYYLGELVFDAGYTNKPDTAEKQIEVYSLKIGEWQSYIGMLYEESLLSNARKEIEIKDSLKDFNPVESIKSKFT